MTLTVPRTVLAGGVVLIVASLAMTIAGGQKVGVSWDEPYHLGKLVNYFDTGWFVDNVSDGVPVDFNAYVYGPVFDLFAHGLTVAMGQESWSEPSSAAGAYEARHLAVALVALLGFAAVGWIARLLLGSWRWSVVAAALLGSIALWSGHAMFNVKDIPVAAGYTMVTLGLMLLVRAFATQSRWTDSLRAALIVTVGGALSIGTRPAIWPAVVVSAALATLSMLALVRAPSPESRVRARGVYLGWLAAAGVGIYVVLVVVYPTAFLSPARALVDAVTQSSDFGGQSSSEKASLASAAGYIPSWLLRQLPILLTLLGVIGLVIAVVVIVRSVIGRTPFTTIGLTFGAWQAVGLGLVGAQLLVLPAGTVLLRSNVYDGVRQFLFIVPPIAILATVGLAAVISAADRADRRGSLIRGAIWGVAGIGVLVPVVDHARLFPYQYAYYNEVTTALTQINGNLPTDYWRTSMRELIPTVPADGATSCGFDPLILGMVPIDCVGQGQIAPYWDTRGTRARDLRVPSGKYLFLESNRGRVAPGENVECTIVSRVVRHLRGQDLVMSYAAICEAPCVVKAAAQCAGKSLAGSNLDGVALPGSNFSQADFTGATLAQSDLTGSDLSGALFVGSVLARANLTGATIEGANFTGADLSDVVSTGLVGQPIALPEGWTIRYGVLAPY